MTRVINSLRPRETCLELHSSNDRCQVETAFHTLILGFRGESQVQQKEMLKF